MGDITERLGAKINEGKTKIIYSHKTDSGLAVMQFKNDITAGDGAKREVYEGKASIHWETNKNVFEFLNRSGVNTHYVESPQEFYAVVKKLDKKIDLEVVTRRMAYGSIVKVLGMEKGERFENLHTQFFYKDDMLNDPMLDIKFAENKGNPIFTVCRNMNEQIFSLLEEAFSHHWTQLIDFKLEYAVIGMEEKDLRKICNDKNMSKDEKAKIISPYIHLIDEYTADSMRLWRYVDGVMEIDPKIPMLEQVDEEGMLDKEVFRQGGEEAAVMAGFREVRDITSKF